MSTAKRFAETPEAEQFQVSLSISSRHPKPCQLDASLFRQFPQESEILMIWTPFPIPFPVLSIRIIDRKRWWIQIIYWFKNCI
jgi:hypothetical protein